MDKITIENWLAVHNIKDYIINEDLSVDVEGDVNLSGKYLLGCSTEIGGVFDCHSNCLISLVGCPTEVVGDFYCNYNRLTSLVGCSVKVGGDFYCNDNELTSLNYCPESIDSSFYCYNNGLTDLFGSPIKVGGDFSCNDNALTSLDGFPIVEGVINCLSNKIDDSELFLYGYNSEQVRQYYISKNLNERLLSGLSEEFGVGIKKKKI